MAGVGYHDVMRTDIDADQALTRLDPSERRWVEEFRDRARALLGDRLRDLRIFGSKTRGDAHEESDLDLLVLVQDLDHPTRIAVVDLASSISAVLSPVIADYERYHAPMNRATGFYQEMRKESVRL